MKMLRLTRSSARRLALRRLVYLEWRGAEQCRRSARLEERLEALIALLQVQRPGARNGNGIWPQPPAKSRGLRIFAGLIVLGVLALASYEGLWRGGSLNFPFLLAALVATAAVLLHVYTFEAWIQPRLKSEGVPAALPDSTLVALLLMAFQWTLPLVLVLLMYWGTKE